MEIYMRGCITFWPLFLPFPRDICGCKVWYESVNIFMKQRRGERSTRRRGGTDLWQRAFVPMTEIPRYTRRRIG